MKPCVHSSSISTRRCQPATSGVKFVGRLRLAILGKASETAQEDILVSGALGCHTGDPNWLVT